MKTQVYLQVVVGENGKVGVIMQDQNTKINSEAWLEPKATEDLIEALKTAVNYLNKKLN